MCTSPRCCQNWCFAWFGRENSAKTTDLVRKQSKHHFQLKYCRMCSTPRCAKSSISRVLLDLKIEIQRKPLIWWENKANIRFSWDTAEYVHLHDVAISGVLLDLQEEIWTKLWFCESFELKQWRMCSLPRCGHLSCFAWFARGNSAQMVDLVRNLKKTSVWAETL